MNTWPAVGLTKLPRARRCRFAFSGNLLCLFPKFCGGVQCVLADEHDNCRVSLVLECMRNFADISLSGETDRADTGFPPRQKLYKSCQQISTTRFEPVFAL
ncbi:hypothetical protein PF005_g10756 [Phytophthora fragariae]|uniref:Uncharacterized protein n=1 Tax=Phytophthora fragariae TaxID=53985 RepID=A0A6A3U4Z5_9STRA|nr:hypothetical protein PF003_g27351 [Phytophthora fragariae]KAE8942495.1 hypothetical protein PF009_g7743 [Phytophthora fragariae]KAE9105959.1 hypothetical protein PF007_g13584 [Phytophthora fragariae]KAE9146595.1 hypothetical protein PF006_g8640 [Phytophthora fragariae]KAE9212058.1 hypothetical protein PF005_g10756 [Phytophthora fragariae]